jgi:hypothetical protein
MKTEKELKVKKVRKRFVSTNGKRSKSKKTFWTLFGGRLKKELATQTDSNLTHLRQTL